MILGADRFASQRRRLQAQTSKCVEAQRLTRQSVQAYLGTAHRAAWGHTSIPAHTLVGGSRGATDGEIFLVRLSAIGGSVPSWTGKVRCSSFESGET